MQRTCHSILLLACALMGCGQRDIVPGVSDSAFVATMADLRRLQSAAPGAPGAPADTVAVAAARRRVLQQRGLTDDQLEQAATALAHDPPRAVAIFQAIDRRAVNARSDSARSR